MWKRILSGFTKWGSMKIRFSLPSWMSMNMEKISISQKRFAFMFFLILLYTKNRLNCSGILHELNQFMKEKRESDIMAELGKEYSKFITDLSMARDDKPI